MKVQRDAIWQRRSAPAHPVTGGLWFLHQMFSCSPQAMLSGRITKQLSTQ